MADNSKKLTYLLVLCFGLGACQQPSSDPNSLESISHISAISRLSIPNETKILYRTESDRGGDTTFIYRIIYSKSPLDHEKYNTIRVSKSSAYESIRSSLQNIDIGHPTNYFLTSRWENDDGEWYGIWLETSNGFYLDLEQIITKGSEAMIAQ